MLYIIAGEASGDLHAANLVKALKAQRPELEVRAMGGDRLAAEGASLVKHIRETNFMGFVEVVANLRTIRRMFKEIKADILKHKPEAVVMVDYPGFNLRMAKWLKELKEAEGLDIKVFYYISPQIWAWKTGRVEQVRQYVDRMLCILPFEQDFYKKYEVEVDYVGHPLLDAILPVLEQPNTLREDLKLDPQKPIVALLPGSRHKEIARKLPVMLQMVGRFPELQFVVAGAPTQDVAYYQSLIGSLPVKLAVNRTYDLLRLSHCALVTSGTATLETALFRVPEVVCYKGDWLSYQIAKRVVMGRIRFISLVNLILDREAVKELIQNDLTPEKLEAELRRLSSDGAYRQRILADYDDLWQRLGSQGASARAAGLLLARMQGGVPAV